jgi:hypothetical protein
MTLPMHPIYQAGAEASLIYLLAMCAVVGLASLGFVLWAVLQTGREMERKEKKRAMNTLIYEWPESEHRIGHR